MLCHTPKPAQVRVYQTSLDVFGTSWRMHDVRTVLRMLSSYVGEESFLKGVSLYLKKHQYKNTVTKDLWEGIQSATGLDISKVMDNWVKQVRGHDVSSPSNIASQTTPCADGVSCHHRHGEGGRDTSPPR